MVDVEEGGGEAEEEQEHGYAEPIQEGALSEEVGGVGSNGHKLTLGKRKHKDRGGREVRSSRHSSVYQQGAGLLQFSLPLQKVSLMKPAPIFP